VACTLFGLGILGAAHRQELLPLVTGVIRGTAS
jgi:hypothetical protein